MKSDSLAGSGEEHGYDDLARRMKKAVARTCPAWLVASRDDLVQAALIKVMKLRRRGEGVDGFSSSYLWSVAHSTLVDEIRRHRRKRELPLDDEPWNMEPTLGSPNPEAEAMGVQVGQGIRDCLQKMVKPRRLAVVLHLQGHTLSEAAELLGWNEKRTDNLLYRGLKNLRECLRGKGMGRQ